MICSFRISILSKVSISQKVDILKTITFNRFWSETFRKFLTSTQFTKYPVFVKYPLSSFEFESLESKVSTNIEAKAAGWSWRRSALRILYDFCIRPLKILPFKFFEFIQNFHGAQSILEGDIREKVLSEVLIVLDLLIELL